MGTVSTQPHQEVTLVQRGLWEMLFSSALVENLNEPAGFWQEGRLQAPVSLRVPTLLRPLFLSRLPGPHYKVLPEGQLGWEQCTFYLLHGSVAQL